MIAGPAWCAQFPTSISLDDLVEPFRSSAKAFIAAIENAGAMVRISATFRPPERAYLMHYAGMIAKSGQDPMAVPPMAGVDIDWTCDGGLCQSLSLAREAAQAMMDGYDIVYPAALVSRHTQGLAVDMTIKWANTINVKSQSGSLYPITTMDQLIMVGSTYGVHKLLSDPPHWSSDGH